MSERSAAIGAGLAHLALIAGLSLAWSAMTPPAPAAPDELAVDLTEIVETPAAVAEPSPAPAATARTAEPEPAPLPVEEPLPAEPEPEPLPTEQPPPPDLATPAPEPDIAPPPPPRKAEAKPPPRPALPVAKPQPRRQPSAEELAAALDEALGPSRPVRAPAASPATGPASPRAAPDVRALATLAQAIKAQILPCWNPPQGVPARVTVVLRLRYAESGSVVGAPEVVAETGDAPAAVRRVFNDSARRAVLRCQPLQLPGEMYAQWRDIELNFDPKDLG